MKTKKIIKNEETAMNKLKNQKKIKIKQDIEKNYFTNLVDLD